MVGADLLCRLGISNIPGREFLHDLSRDSIESRDALFMAGGRQEGERASGFVLLLGVPRLVRRSWLVISFLVPNALNSSMSCFSSAKRK